MAHPEPDLSSFYITGGTLPAGAPSYVERQADRALLDALSRGEFCYVLDTRQMGKSSLMIRTGGKLKALGVAVAVLDLTAIGQNLTPDRWYAGLLQRLGEQIGEEDALTDYWRDHKDVGPLQRFLGAVRLALSLLEERQATQKPPLALVLFLDEIDAVRSLPFSADEFFAGIRECYNRRAIDPLFRRLAVCLLGVATPADLIQDTRMSPFNIGQRILLTDFTPQEAAPLVQGLGGRGGKTRGQADGGTRRDTDAGRLLDRVLYWTGGHPYMTQRLCYVLAERTGAAPSRALTARVVDEACEQLFLTRQARDTDDNLAFVRNRLLRSEVDLVDLLEMYRQVRAGKHIPDDETNPLCSVLRLAGIVRAERGELHIRNRIYDQVFDPQWVQSHMPGAELRRQRAAYRRGALRATSIAACVVAAFVALSIVAFSQATRANAEAKHAEAARIQADSVSRALQIALREQAASAHRADLSARQADASAHHARAAEKAAEGARRLADSRRREAEAQRSVAQAATREAQREKQQLQAAAGRAFTADAQAHMDEGDMMGAARPLLAAMRMDAGDPDRHAMHTRRMGMAMYGMPRLTCLFPCGAPVVWSAFGQDERCIAAASGSRVRLWDVSTGRSLGALLHPAAVTDAAFSPDRRRLAVACADGSVYVWSVQQYGAAHRQLWHGRCPARADRVVWSPNSELVAAGHDASAAEPYTVTTWDAAAGQIRYRVPMKYSCNDLAFSPDSHRLVVSTASYTAKILDAHSGVPLLSAGRAYGLLAPSISFSPDGRRFVLVAGFVDYGMLSGTSARVIDLATGEPNTPPVKCTGPCAFSPDGARLALANGVDAQIVDAQTGAALVVRMHHDADITTVSFSPDGSYLLTASDDGAARIWDVSSGALAAPPLRQAGAIQTASFDRSGWRVLTSGIDGAVRVWDLAPAIAGRTLATLPTGTEYDLPVNRVLRRHARLVAFDRKTGGCALWDLSAGRMLTVAPAAVRWISAAADPEARRLVLCGTGAGGEVVAQSYDLATGRPLSLLHGLPGSVIPHPSWQYPALCATGDSCVYAASAGQITLLNLMTGAIVHRFEPAFNHASISTDGRRVAAYSAHAAGLADLSTGQWVSPLMPLQPDDSVWFSPHGAGMVVVTPSGGLEARDTASGRMQVELPRAGISRPVMGITFSEDERRVAICSEMGWILVDLARGRVIARETLPAAAHWNLAQFRADGKRLVVASTSETALLDTRSGRILRRLNHSTVPSEFSPDGRYFAWAYDNHVEIVNTESGRLKQDLVHPGSVFWGGTVHDSSAWFSSDSRLILTSCADGYTRLWDVETGERVGPRIARSDLTVGVCFAGPDRILVETSPVSTQPARLIALPPPLSAERDAAMLASLTDQEALQMSAARLAATWQSVRRREPAWFMVSNAERSTAAINAADAEAARRTEGRSEEMRMLEGVAASPPGREARFWRQLAMDCMHVGWWQSALDALDKLDALEPEREDTLFARAHVAAETHQYDAAAAAYAKLAALHPPRDPYAVSMVKEQSRFLYRINRWPDVVSVYFPLINANQAPSDLTRIAALAILTGHEEAYTNLCRRVAAMQEPGDTAFYVCSLAPGCLQDYTRIVEQAEKAYTPGPNVEVEDVGVLAMLHCRAGEYHRALDDAERAAHLPQSGDRTAQLARAIALHNLGRNAEAKALLASLAQAFVGDGDDHPVGEHDITERVIARLRYREAHALLASLP